MPVLGPGDDSEWSSWCLVALAGLDVKPTKFDHSWRWTVHVLLVVVVSAVPPSFSLPCVAFNHECVCFSPSHVPFLLYVQYQQPQFWCKNAKRQPVIQNENNENIFRFRSWNVFTAPSTPRAAARLSSRAGAWGEWKPWRLGWRSRETMDAQLMGSWPVKIGQ